ncbi:MAG: TonB family protein [Thermoanaerobaculaceae bacterium]|nr:TonB family protein [Thermoanaerobaculaceae bacterium]
MIDPVSNELAQRAHLDLPWRWAVAGALGVHLAVAGVLLLSPGHRPRALTLPSVQVRIVAAPAQRRAEAGGPPPAHPAAAARPRSPANPPKPKPARPHEPPPRHVVPGSNAAAPQPVAAAEPAPAAPGGAAGAAQGGVASASGGIVLGAGGAGEEPFPFAYYLNRVLALIEGNWFRPPAPAGTVCRVRCVIERSGRLAEAGLESPSASPSFDRAALRAVYAAAPFPPLPQGFGGSTLTMHLEFGP